jgi:hypothetical protein
MRLHTQVRSGYHQLRVSPACGVSLPYGNHVVVHLLQLFLGDIERVRRRVELVCLKGLVGQTNLEGLVVVLDNR